MLTGDADMVAIKNEGIRKELFQRVQDALWESQRSLEHSRETSGARHTQFEKMVADAKQHIKDAERFYTELQNYPSAT